MYLDQKFLAFVQAIESYHRRMITNYEIPEDYHKKRLEEITRAVPENHRKWLQERLAYSNEPTLRRRMRDMMDKCSDVVKPNKSVRNAYISKTVNTRNYLTHYDSSLESKTAKGEQLRDLTQGLKLLLEISLLKELGFESKDINEFYSRNWEYKRRIIDFAKAYPIKK